MKKFNKFLLVCCYGLGTFGIQLGLQMKIDDYFDNKYDDDSKTERFCHLVGIITEEAILYVAMFSASSKLASKMRKQNLI